MVNDPKTETAARILGLPRVLGRGLFFCTHCGASFQAAPAPELLACRVCNYVCQRLDPERRQSK